MTSSVADTEHVTTPENLLQKAAVLSVDVFAGKVREQCLDNQRLIPSSVLISRLWTETRGLLYDPADVERERRDKQITQSPLLSVSCDSYFQRQGRRST